MTQTGAVRKTTGRSYQSYSDLMKTLHAAYGANAIAEWSHHIKQTTADAAAEVMQVGTTAGTEGVIGSTEITLKCSITNGDDADYTGKLVVIRYKDVHGAQKSATCTLTATMHTTAVAFVPSVTDFYCWDTDNYTAAQCLYCNLAIKGGDTLIVHTSGDEAAIWGTISAAATVALDAQLIGVGTIYGYTESDQADETFVVTITYLTPWGELKGASYTIPAAGTTVTRLTETSSSLLIQDFYRIRTMVSSAAAIDEISLTDSTGTAAVYATITIGNLESVHSRFMALGAAYGESYFGELIATFPSIAATATITVTRHAKGDAYPRTTSFDLFVAQSLGDKYLYPIQLEPLSEVVITIEDDNVAHADANIIFRAVEHEV